MIIYDGTIPDVVDAMKIMIGVLFIGLLLCASVGIDPSSLTSLSGFESLTLIGVIDGAIIFCGKAIESIGASYHDFMKSSTIMNFFKYYLPRDQNPGTIALLCCGFVGLWGYGRKRKKK